MVPQPPNADSSAPRASAPLSAAVRQRLQKVFEHAQRSVEKNDYDYANQLLAQCVSEDPANLIYLQHFIANLQKKYGNNKKGAKLAGLKIKSHRSALNRAAAKGDWEPAFRASCAALSLNPWDIPTLLAIADGCQELQLDECQLYYLRLALDADSKNVNVNRQAGYALQRMGQFDQAIACWLRVKQAVPHDEEATQAISRLSVEKTIHEGGYNPTLLSEQSDGDGTDALKQTLAQLSIGTHQDDAESTAEPLETRLVAAIRHDPTDLENYLQLSDLLMRDNRLDDVAKVLQQASEASGGGDLRVCERREDWQLRRVYHLLAIAEQRHEQDPSDESQQLANQMRAQANQVELEVFTAKSDRDPQNSRLKFELGLRFMQAGKPKEAISPFQAARTDPKRKAAALLNLGECFQRIEQFKLAMANYEQAIEACEEPDSESKKRALYRAGVLATGLRELDRAERHLTELAGIDFVYRDVAKRLDKIAHLRDSG